jgi:hypothetical protein
VDVPLGEDIELYDAEIMNGGVVVRSFLALSTPTFTYNTAQQIADFGSIQTSVSVRVYQLSTIIGRGYGGVTIL